MINAPNTLSVFRLVMIPSFCKLFLMGNSDHKYYYWSGLCLALSGLSDLFDGYLARKLNQETVLGKWLDPIADKLTLGAVVGCMWFKFASSIPILHLLFSLLFLKELIMAIGGIFIFRNKKIEILPARWWGKVGTGGFYACMIGVLMISMFAPDWPLRDKAIIALVSLSVALMIFAFICYARIGVRLLKFEKED